VILQDILTRTIEESRQNLEVVVVEAQLENRTKYFFAIENKEMKEVVVSVLF